MAVFATGQTILAENVDFETYLRQYEGQHVEYDDGRVIELSPSSARHNVIVRFLANLFEAYLRLTGEGKVFSESVTMRLAVEGKIRGPLADVLVLLNTSLGRLHEAYLDGPADLVVEVVSPESDRRDRITKFEMYEQTGVREYWLIDATFHEAAFYVLEDSKNYSRQKLDENGVYHSTVLPRFQFEVGMLFQDNEPGVFEAIELAKKMVER